LFLFSLGQYSDHDLAKLLRSAIRMMAVYYLQLLESVPTGMIEKTCTKHRYFPERSDWKCSKFQLDFVSELINHPRQAVAGKPEAIAKSIDKGVNTKSAV
jgi:hypothetical protein